MHYVHLLVAVWLRISHPDCSSASNDKGGRYDSGPAVELFFGGANTKQTQYFVAYFQAVIIFSACGSCANIKHLLMSSSFIKAFNKHHVQ